MNSELMRANIRTIVRGAYDIQKLRIQTGNRIVANFKAKLGQEPGEKEEELDEQSKDLLASLRRSYKRITDGVATFPRQATFKGDELISNYTELVLLAQYFELEHDEDAHFRRLGKVLKDFPIYNEFLEGVRGVGPAMAGVIISEIDIHKAEYASSIWKYAGLDVAPDGRGRSRQADHLVNVEYETRDGETKSRKSITFNPFLKTKLVGVLGSSFIKQPPDKCVYRQMYDNYKHRLENHPAHQEKTKAHRHNMAVRYIVKRFLVDLYSVWRPLEGLPAAPEYSEAKLGKVHGKAKAA